MACDCLDDTNTLLAEHNTKLPGTIVLPRDGRPGYVIATLLTEKVAPRGKRPVVMAPTFCPFCGLRYQPAAHDAASSLNAEAC